LSPPPSTSSFGRFFQGKPTEHLLGPGITPGPLNDDFNQKEVFT
jgi:hypothetical protein